MENFCHAIKARRISINQLYGRRRPGLRTKRTTIALTPDSLTKGTHREHSCIPEEPVRTLRRSPLAVYFSGASETGWRAYACGPISNKHAGSNKHAVNGRTSTVRRCTSTSTSRAASCVPEFHCPTINRRSTSIAIMLTARSQMKKYGNSTDNRPWRNRRSKPSAGENVTAKVEWQTAANKKARQLKLSGLFGLLHLSIEN